MPNTHTNAAALLAAARTRLAQGAPVKSASKAKPAKAATKVRLISCEDCGTEVVGATWNQKRCHACSEARQSAFLNNVIVPRAMKRQGLALAEIERAHALEDDPMAEEFESEAVELAGDYEVGSAKKGRTISCEDCGKTVIHATGNQKRCSSCAKARKESNPFYQAHIVARAIAKNEEASGALAKQIAVEMRGDEPANSVSDRVLAERDRKIQALRDSLVGNGMDVEDALALAISAVNEFESLV